MNNNQNRNIKILKNSKIITSENTNYEQLANKSITEINDLSNVLNLTGDFDNSTDKGQAEIVKDFVRDARKNIKLEDFKKNEMNELIDSEAFSKFNLITKIKFCYSKHEWTCIAIRESLAILILIYSFILYYKSLTSKYNLENLVFYLYYPMEIHSFCQCVGSGILLGLVLFFIYLKIIFIEHILYIFIINCFFIYKNHGNTVGHHGLFNAFIFLFITFFVFGLLISFHLIYKFIKRKNYMYIIISLIIIFFFIFEGNMIHRKKIHDYSCGQWEINLNGTSVNKINYIDKNDFSCYINKPKGHCYMNKLINYFDLTKDQKINCKNRKESEKAIFLNSIIDNKEQFRNTKIFGFPYTNKDPQFYLKNQKSDGDFRRLVMKNIIDVEKLKPNEAYPESVIDFSKNNFGELKINLIKNESLEKERLIIEKEKNNNYIFNNIFMIYSDATSRAHFQRSLPKLSKFIQRFLPYNKENTMRSFQFNKYHSFYWQTHYNIIPMFYGDSFFSHNGTHSVKYF